ncbi:hypothetical protein M2352_003386 [Azospirillum fermentarium]|nr:hypothetical protein [Azospirillum fermentarium]MCW2247752.1 hypothetical protein [Azospirillum fermentarium]
MKVQTQRRMVQRLIPAIKLIAGDFEDFGGKLLDHLLHARLEHSGVNFLGLPVSRVLDSTSDDGAVVAQYSAETDYFTAGMEKASGDITKALTRRPDAKRILLIAAEEKRPIIADDFKKKVLQEDRMKGRSIGIFGAQSIAAWIVRNLLFNDAAIEELAEYLPELAQMRDEAASDLLFPKLPALHSPRPTVTAEIGRRLAVSPCLVLTGIGGCGKSEAATAFGVDAAKNYDLRIWLEPDEFKGAAALKALPLVRGGTKRNIATLLKRQRCLLVIDDPLGSVDKGWYPNTNSGELDEGDEGRAGLVITGCDPPHLFEFVEHSFDFVASLVGLLVKSGHCLAGWVRLDDRTDSPDQQMLTVGIAIITGIGEQGLGRGDLQRDFHQRDQLLAVGCLAPGHDEGQGPPGPIAPCVDLARKAAARTTKSRRAGPPFAPAAWL